MSYAIKNLNDVKNVAPDFGLDDGFEARFPREELDAEQVGFAHYRIEPGKKAPAHRHDDAEEVYVILSGGGKAKLDDEIVDVKAMDVLRVAPAVARSFESGPDGVELLVFGARHEGDGAFIEGDFWA